MEKYVVSLEIAKKMEEAGWEKETEFWWVKTSSDKWILVYDFNKNAEGNKIVGIKEYYPAPLSDEILEELPDYTTMYRIGRGNKCWHCLTKKDDLKLTNTLPHALGLMWLYLKQNNQLTKR